MSDTNRILSDIRAYLRISAASVSKASAARALDTYEKALVYGKLDGKTSQSKIEQATGVPQRTVSSWLVTFVQEGLVAPPDEFNEGHKSLFALQELGIELTALKKREKKGVRPSQEPTPVTAQVSTNEAQKGGIQKYLEGEKSEPTK